MGSFACTCAISNLPIEGGDPVRFFLLTENPYKDSIPVEQHGLWVPRTPPLKGEYDDYGSVTNVEKGPQRDVWLEALSHDVVPVGWGDNCCHDVPVDKHMTWEQMLLAIHERRLKVRREFRGLNPMPRPNFPQREIPAGIPTRTRIQNALKRGGFDLYVSDSSPDPVRGSYLVSRVRYGKVRIRFQGSSKLFGQDSEFLEKVLPHLTEYATSIHAGEGNYANQGEMTVLPRPGTPDYHGFRKRTPVEFLRVGIAMVREDVWRALIENWPGSGRTFTLYLQKAKHLNREVEKRMKGISELSSKLIKGDNQFLDALRDLEMDALAKFGLSFLNGRDDVPFLLGVGTHWKLMRQKYPIIPRGFLRSSMELHFIGSLLSATRLYWRPSYAIGPQLGEWDKHRHLMKTLLDVATSHRRTETE